MVSRDFIFWEVDVQADFMLPGGNLYVPGAEKLLPNIRRLTDAARQGQVFLVSHGCFHTPDDPEFKIFPPHCVKGTAGSDLVPEALTQQSGARAQRRARRNFPKIFRSISRSCWKSRRSTFLKAATPMLSSRGLGDRPEFVVFGVVTEYCVSFAVKGLLERRRRVAVVQDAIETLKREDGEKRLTELQQLGARITTTDQALSALTR